MICTTQHYPVCLSQINSYFRNTGYSRTSVFSSKILFYRESVCKHVLGGAEGEADSPGQAETPMWGSVPQTWDMTWAKGRCPADLSHPHVLVFSF